MNKPPAPNSVSADQAAEWLKRMASVGDKAAFISLFEYFAPRIKSYLRGQGLETGLADDLTQDVMFQIWQRAGQFDPGKARASTWIYTIARNRMIDERRKHKGQLPARELDEEMGSDAPVAAMELQADKSRIHDAVSALPPEQRVLIEESYFQEKPHSEIARKQKLPLGTVKSRIRLAMERLKKSLGEET
jgi:RNA polymerase sigma-70 factor (ECF subfamily)